MRKTEDEQIFIAMAYYEGETLKKKVSSNQLSVNSVRLESISMGTRHEPRHECRVTV